jgi:hypothetical protein
LTAQAGVAGRHAPKGGVAGVGAGHGFSVKIGDA